MRFPHQALLRIRPVSPISDNAPDTALYGRNIRLFCLATNTSGTDDPGIQFNGEDIQSGAFGDNVDITINSIVHKRLRQQIDNTMTPFSAKLMLRLYAVYERATIIDTRTGMATPTIRDVTLMDNSDVTDRNFIGYPMVALRTFHPLTTLTFNAKRVLL